MTAFGMFGFSRCKSGIADNAPPTYRMGILLNQQGANAYCRRWWSSGIGSSSIVKSAKKPSHEYFLLRDASAFLL